jgi:hypothetical protein
MPTNAYRDRLAKLHLLTRKSIGLRNVLRRGVWSGGDSHDLLCKAKDLRAELAFTEREKARLRHELGLPEPSGPVSLKLRPAEIAALQAAGKPAVKPVRVVVPSYVTKVIRPA